jgi:hypothetical protein
MAMQLRGKTYIDLGGPDGNAFVLMGIADQVLRSMGHGSDEITAFNEDCKSGNYEHLLRSFIAAVGSQVHFVNVPEQFVDLLDETDADYES